MSIWGEIFHSINRDLSGGVKFQTESIVNFKWSTEANLPQALYSSSCVVYNNKIHVIGGCDVSGHNVNTHYVYDGSTWSTEANLPQALSSSSCVVYNNKIHVIGGCNVSGHNVNTHYVYDGSTWSTEANLPQALSSSSC